MSQNEIEQEIEVNVEEEKQKVFQMIKGSLSQLDTNFTGSFSFIKLNLAEKELNSTFGALERYQHIRFLYLQKNLLTKISEIQHLKYLQQLDLSENQLQECEFLNSREYSFPFLEYINLSQNQLKSVTIINCPTLKEINLNKNQINSLEISENLITKLEVRNNQLNNLNFVINLKSLEELYCAENMIVNLYELNVLKNLRVIHLRKNLVEQITLKELDQLEYLNLRENRISKYEEISNCIALKNLKNVNFLVNPRKIEKEIEEEQKDEPEEEMEELVAEKFLMQYYFDENVKPKAFWKFISKIELTEELIEEYKTKISELIEEKKLQEEEQNKQTDQQKSNEQFNYNGRRKIFLCLLNGRQLILRRVL